MWIIQLIHKADPALLARHPTPRVLQGNRYLFVSDNPYAPDDDSDRLPDEANQAAFDAMLNSQNPNGKHIKLTKGQASEFAPQEHIEEP